MQIRWFFLHGFWGQPSDFDELIDELYKHRPKDQYIRWSVLDVRPTGFSGLVAPEKWRQQISVDVEKNEINIFVGYSLGGRILTSLLLEPDTKAGSTDPSRGLWCLDSRSRFFLLSSAFGLGQEVDKTARIAFEDDILNKISSMDLEAFWLHWNSYAIFKQGATREIPTDWTIKQLSDYFSAFRLSRQDYFGESLHRSQFTTAFVGAEDKKYQDIFQNIEYELIPEAGHRLIVDNPKALANSFLKKVDGFVL